LKRATELSSHAHRRSAQRAIPELLMDLLVQYGDMREQRGGTVVLEWSPSTAKWMRNQLKEIFAHWDQQEHVYTVAAADGSVITAAHRYRRHGLMRVRRK
jgi:hypothetical protein